MWGFCLAAGLLLLPNLTSSGLLWQDEAETAVLAQNTLRFGYPRVSDGMNRINPALVTGPGDCWAYHPWLQFYMTAVAFWLFGPTTWAARLLPALGGIVCMGLTFQITLRIFQHPGVARLTTILTLFSIPFILHVRQCRYYALGIFGTLWVLYAYIQAREGRRYRWWWLAAGLVVLFHSHHGALIPTIAALTLDCWRQGIDRLQRKQAVLAMLAAAALTLPWFLLLNLTQHQGAFSVQEFSHHIQFYGRQINRFIVPVGFLLLVLACRGIRPGSWWRQASEPQRGAMRIVGLILLCNLAFIVAIPWQRHFRYLIHLLPLFYMIEAVCLWGWLSRSRWVLVFVCLMMIATDVLHYSAPYLAAQAIPRVRAKIAREHGLVWPQSLLAKYLYELTHEYRGPLEGIIETLRQQARPGDTVKIPYDDHGIIFYTGLRVEDLNHFTAETYPDWIIPREGWVVSEFFASPYWQDVQRRYDRLEIDAPDVIWQNRPDPGYHRFRTATHAPRVVMYHRRNSSAKNNVSRSSNGASQTKAIASNRSFADSLSGETHNSPGFP